MSDKKRDMKTSIGCADCGSSLINQGQHYVPRDNYYMASHREVNYVLVAICDKCNVKEESKGNGVNKLIQK